MSNNQEEKIYKDKVHLFIALQRPSKQGVGHKSCIRHVIKRDEAEELKVFEAKIKAVGGEWRIYRTVNARDVNKAYKVFMKMMIDYPERASCIDSIWITALLQRECKAEKYFMLDVDTKDEEKILKLEYKLWSGLNKKVEFEKYLACRHDKENILIINKIKSPSGWHYITLPFDTREVCKLDYVTLLRDGYYYIKTINEDN